MRSTGEWNISIFWNCGSDSVYRAVNIVGFFADSTPLLERYVGFWVAYLVPCCCMWLALIPILLGRNFFGQSIQSTGYYRDLKADLCFSSDISNE